MSTQDPSPPARSEHDLEREIRRLNKIVRALMDRAERTASQQASEFDLLQKTVLLENQVRERTRALESERATQRALIRQLEDANNRVLQSEKLASIGQLAAGVAHEINNPISYVASNLEALRTYVAAMDSVLEAYGQAESSIPDSGGLRSRIEAARKAADLEYLRADIDSLISESLDGAMRVRRIVQDLRDFSRDGNSHREVVELQAVVESALRVAQNEVKYKADVVCHFGTVPPLECVPSQLGQVLLNLLVNAAQAIDGHGCITIETAADGRFARITVRDTGGGIAPEVLPRIFDPFFTTKPVGSGTGLGLSVSHGIVEKHGGRIEVASTVGEGTVFTIRLPLAETPAADEPADGVVAVDASGCEMLR